MAAIAKLQQTKAALNPGQAEVAIVTIQARFKN
jgi:hypothetical protein